MNERKIIFSNLLNKVPVQNIALAFNKTENEILLDFKYIIQKIKNYCFLNSVPPIFCDTLPEAQKNKYSIFPILDKLDLEKAPIYKITYKELNKDGL